MSNEFRNFYAWNKTLTLSINITFACQFNVLVLSQLSHDQMESYKANILYVNIHQTSTKHAKDSQKIKIKKKTKTPRITDEGWNSQKRLS